jgi:hypothetical protein
MDAEAIAADQTLNHAYAEGRADEREEWLPLAEKLRELFRLRQVAGGGAVFSLQDVLDLSKELARPYK